MSTASDPDGDSLTYAWNIAGNTATGASVGPVTFTNGFSGSASVTVTDGKGGSATSSANFIVGSLSGTWSGTFAGFPFTMTLTQTNAGTVSGSFRIVGATTFTGNTDPASTNTINSAGHIILRFKATANVSDFTFTGDMDTSGTRLTGSAAGSGFTGQTVILAKQ